MTPPESSATDPIRHSTSGLARNCAIAASSQACGEATPVNGRHGQGVVRSGAGHMNLDRHQRLVTPVGA